MTSPEPAATNSIDWRRGGARSQAGRTGVAHHLELLHIGGVAVVGFYERPALVEHGADDHAERKHVAEQAAL